MGQEFPPSHTPRQRLSRFLPEIFRELLKIISVKGTDLSNSNTIFYLFYIIAVSQSLTLNYALKFRSSESTRFNAAPVG
jgi:hypothetical protein